MNDAGIFVMMEKKTGNLVEYVPDSWFGKIIFYGMAVGNESINENTPVIFEDDERFDLGQYEFLGEL